MPGCAGAEVDYTLHCTVREPDWLRQVARHDYDTAYLRTRRILPAFCFSAKLQMEAQGTQRQFPVRERVYPPRNPRLLSALLHPKASLVKDGVRCDCRPPCLPPVVP